ncbi:hypothetical protein G6F56_014028 [Rhizopus delemar]|nr:hypothetical protein G6F56_014028 [Rhizopus delemar]
MKSQYDWLLQETKKLNENHDKMLMEVEDFKEIVVSEASEIRQLKDLLNKISEKLLEQDVGTSANASVPRRRDITLNFKKIVKPNNARVRTRDRVHVLLGDIKNYTKTDGTDVHRGEKYVEIRQICGAFRQKSET